MADGDELDLISILESFTNFVQNERIRSYNEGPDAGIARERERCIKIAEGEIDPKDYSGAAKVIISYIQSGGTPGAIG